MNVQKFLNIHFILLPEHHNTVRFSFTSGLLADYNKTVPERAQQSLFLRIKEVST